MREKNSIVGSAPSDASRLDASSPQPASEPVLILAFNRPDLFQKVLTRTLLANPARLYVAVDGPRQGSKSDVEAIGEIIKIIKSQTKTIEVLMREKNLGCKNAVATGIDWFFRSEKMGIILEEDCIPDISFFEYCSTLLNHFEDEKEVFSIAGYRGGEDELDHARSFSFSKYPQIWGWATWARVWRDYDPNISDWPRLRKKQFLKDQPLNFKFFQRVYWTARFNDVYHNRIDTWDYQLTMQALKTKGLTIIPGKNLVVNAGFDKRATHTKRPQKALNRRTRPVGFPLLIPENIRVDEAYDAWLERRSFRITRSVILRPARFSLLVAKSTWRRVADRLKS